MSTTGIDPEQTRKTDAFWDGRCGREPQSNTLAYLAEYDRGRIARGHAMAPMQCQRSWARGDNSGDGSS